MTIDCDARVYTGADGADVTVRDVIAMHINGHRTEEFCPYCTCTPEIPVIGGRCPTCGHWLLPCSMCDMNTSDCAHCPFEQFRPSDSTVTDLEIPETLSGTEVMLLINLLQENGLEFRAPLNNPCRIFVRADVCTVRDVLDGWFKEGTITCWGDDA